MSKVCRGGFHTKSVLSSLITVVSLLLGAVPALHMPHTVQAQTSDLVSFPSSEIEFIVGPQLISGSSLNPSPWFDQNAATKGIEFGEAFPVDPPAGQTLVGSVSVTTGSQTVVGEGTRFLLDFPGAANNYYVLITDASGVTHSYFLTSVQDDTHLVLTAAWQQVTGSGLQISSMTGGAADAYVNLNYYDQALCQYNNYYRTGDARYLAYARKIADSWWRAPFIASGTFPVDSSLAPRNISMAGLMLRAMDGRPEMWPWITEYTRAMFDIWVGSRVTYSGLYFGVRDPGYMLLHAANLARVHPDPAVRQELRDKVLNAAVNYYGRLQYPDGSWRWGDGADGAFWIGDATQPFQVGLLLEGLVAVHRLTNDDRVKTSIARGVEALYVQAYNPNGWRGMYYVVHGSYPDGTNCANGCGTAANPFPPSDLGQIAEARQLSATTLHAFGYAFSVTGDARFRQWGDEILDSTYTGTDGFRGLAWGRPKEYDESYRAGGRYLVWRLGGSIPTPSPTPTPSASPTPTPAPTPTPTPTPSPTQSETVWVEDSLPAGATSTGSDDPWNWVSESPSPYSGALASQSTLQSGMHQSFFTGATATLTVNSGDTLFAYVYIDPSNVPNEIMLQWNDADWDHRAYWGANNISLGTDNTDSRRHMGPMPAAGQWARLEVPASQVGLENKTINGLAFTLHDGRATWDRVGKTSQAAPSPTPTPTPTPNPLGESILLAKRDGQNLANQVASAGGGGFGSSNALQANLAEQVALDLFILEIQQAYAYFNANPGIYPAATRIDIELAGALQRALEANFSFAQGDIAGFRNHLRQAIGHLELSGVLIAYPNVANPIDVASYVVRQHYVDFFDREPEQAGNEFWVGQLSACGTDAQCFEDRRIHVSAAFFLSIEFQRTGYFVHRLYKSSYRRVPTRTEFMPDNAVLGQGVVVGTAGWEDRLAANKDQFLQSWVQRPIFISRYSALSDRQYVDALIFNIAVTISTAERDALVQDLANGASRASILGRLADNELFSANEFNRAFVLMQYFGYLRRDPDNGGFTFWLNKLNEFGGNYQSADMVKAFLASAEYRRRFAL